jgi:hypothetical protein
VGLPAATVVRLKGALHGSDSSDIGVKAISLRKPSESVKRASRANLSTIERAVIETRSFAVVASRRVDRLGTESQINNSSLPGVSPSGVSFSDG